MNFFQQHRSTIRHAWIGAGIFGGTTLLVQLSCMVAMRGDTQLSWNLFMLYVVISTSLYSLLDAFGGEWTMQSFRSIPLLIFLMMILVNAFIGAICWISLRALGLRIRDFFMIQ